MVVRFLLKFSFLVAAVWAQASEEVHFEVRSEVHAWPGEDLLFKDLLEDTSAKFNLPASVLAQKIFSGEEVLGETQRFSSAEISKRLRRALFATSFVRDAQFRLPLEVKVSPHPQKLMQARLRSDLTQALQSGCDCKIELSRVQIQWPEDLAPDAIWSWEALPEAGQLRGNLLVSVDIQTNQQNHRRWVQAKSRLLRKVPVAVRTVSYGEVFHPENMRLEWRDVTHLSQDSLRENEVLGFATNRLISSGQIIRRRDLTRPQVIQFGDLVRVESGQEGLAITTEGVAQQAGAVGESIKVKVTSTNKTVSALVKERGKVKVH